MQDLNDFYYYAQVVEHKGFTAAGHALGMHKSKLSRRIQQLEEGLGVRLINRSSRSFSLTEIGREFYHRCVAMLVEAEAAERFIAESHTEPRGLVRIACPVALLQYRFGALFADFMARCPAVELHIESTNRRVDILKEGFDIAIRVRFPPLPPSDLVMRRLDDSEQSLVAAPDFLAKPINSPADLVGLASLDHERPSGKHEWQLQQTDGQSAAIPHQPRLVTDDMAMLRQAALAGVGIVQLPTFLVQEDLTQGHLQLLLPEWSPKAGIIHALFPSRRGLLPSVRALLDHLADGCAAQRHTLPAGPQDQAMLEPKLI
jgi:DNA-binding transcriptional LysR family regulator